MGKIPFQVSARAARLIGRENVANTEGAIIELVKNCYDADANNCILLFDNRYSEPPSFFTRKEVESFSRLKENELIELINLFYFENPIHLTYEKRKLDFNEKNEDEFYLKYKRLEHLLREKCSISIIDDGDGMDEKVIKNHWMIIGTDNKLSDIYSKAGRIRTGAKGIGRFALDRLGSIASMKTKKKQKDTVSIWDVNWSDFEILGKVLGEVYANLEFSNATNK